MFVHFFSLHGNRDGHIAGLMEAKPEELGNICQYRKDAHSYALQVLYSCKFSVGAPVKAAINVLKNNVCSLFFSLHKNRDSHIAGLMEAKPEELGKICSNKKDVPFYVLQFCIYANFLSVQLLRRYEFFKK